MTITDDIVKSLRNATPLYAVAGTADLAAEKLRGVPALIGRLREEVPGHFERIKGTDPKAVQERVATGAKDAQARVAAGAKDAQTRLTETYRDMDLKAFREMPDFKKLGESVQDLALQGVGRATGYAVKARETYDELAERGKGAVATWRGEGDADGKDRNGGELTGGAKAKPATPKSAPKSEARSGADTAKPAPKVTPKDVAKPAAARKSPPRRTSTAKKADKSAE